MIVQNNTMGLRAYNANRKTIGSIKKNLEKLSSGYRINRSADDAAGLAVSERIRAKVTELDRCQRNAAEGMDLARTADAALQEVNDILKRARELCIQAENGTYGNQELAAISDELNQLFSEIDRISAGSYHNSINLFRNCEGHTFHDEYDEQFTPVGDDLQLWGELDFIQTTDFDRAEPATPASVTFKLSDDVDFNDINSLNGKAIRVGSYTYYFAKSGATIPSGVTVTKYLSSYASTEAALRSLTSDSNVQSVTVNKDERTVTLTAPLRELNYTVVINDKLQNCKPVPNGDGEWKNGVIVSNPAGSASLKEVDGQGATNNKPVYSSTVTGTFSLSSVRATLTQADVTNLNGNRLTVGTQTIKLKDLSPTVGMTRDQLGTKLAEAISNLGSSYTASYASNKLTVTISGQSATSSSSITLSEYVTPATAAETETTTTEGPSWSSTAANITVQKTQAASLEGYESYKVTVPQNLSLPFSFRIGSQYYMYYDSSKNTTATAEYPHTEYTSGSSKISPYNMKLIDMKGKTQQDIMKDIAKKVESLDSNIGDITINGNELTVKASYINTEMNLSGRITGAAVTVTPYKQTTTTKPGTGTPGTSRVLGFYFEPFTQTVTVPFSLGSSFDADKLVGSGFSVNSLKFEFVNGTGTGLNSGYTDIDISGCTDFNSLKDKVQARMGSSYTVTIDSSNASDVKLNISMNRSTSSYSSVSVTDGLLGIDGLIDGGPVEFSGGVNTNHSQTAIDFSAINEDNLDTLLGKGFRIRCASCSGEYINVFFCWTNDGSVPPNFGRVDPVTGITRIIHNVPVELSKITSGDKIVEDIVKQVRPSLKHYTDVAVGDPPTILLAMEKRIGDVVDQDGLHLGRVETGVEANFVYSVELKTVQDPLEGDLDELKDSVVNIYVGSDPGSQIIPIHLPYIDLYHLRLCPPEKGVDLTSEEQSAADWLGRIARADLAISSARGTIGADYNRLEHTIQDLSNTSIQLSDAYSTIRDADVAELMMKQVKDQILLQAQQSMLSQANQMPQGVLQFMQ